MNAAVQTSAPAVEADMFAGSEPTPIVADDLVIEFQARLVRAATVTNKLVDHGTQLRPVLCLDLVPVGPNLLHQRMHVEKPYPESRRKEAEALAATLKRGAHITFRTTLVNRLVKFPNALSVALSPSPDHHA